MVHKMGTKVGCSYVKYRNNPENGHKSLNKVTKVELLPPRKGNLVIIYFDEVVSIAG